MKKFFMYFVAAVMLLSFNSCEQKSLKKVFPMPTPSMNWGASEKTIEKEMKDLGFRLEKEGGDDEESSFLFSYEHGRYSVANVFIYSKYAFFVCQGMSKSEVIDMVDWLDSHYVEDEYLRFNGGYASLYKSKDDNTWAFAYIDSDEKEYVIYWGSKKYASEYYEDLLNELR